jgi:hypothetical protein
MAKTLKATDALPAGTRLDAHDVPLGVLVRDTDCDCQWRRCEAVRGYGQVPHPYEYPWYELVAFGASCGAVNHKGDLGVGGKRWALGEMILLEPIGERPTREKLEAAFDGCGATKVEAAWSHSDSLNFPVYAVRVVDALGAVWNRVGLQAARDLAAELRAERETGVWCLARVQEYRKYVAQYRHFTTELDAERRVIKVRQSDLYAYLYEGRRAEAFGPVLYECANVEEAKAVLALLGPEASRLEREMRQQREQDVAAQRAAAKRREEQQRAETALWVAQQKRRRR